MEDLESKQQFVKMQEVEIQEKLREITGALQKEEKESIKAGLSNEGMMEEIENRFTYHPPKEGQPQRYKTIRAKAKQLAQSISSTCPYSRERATALTRLDEAVFWANAAIARNE